MSPGKCEPSSLRGLVTGFASIRRSCVLVVLAVVLSNCHRDLPVWPSELVSETYDAEGMTDATRKEYRRLVEVCAADVCGILEVTWWTRGDDSQSHLVGVRVVQLGGSRVNVTVMRQPTQPGLDVQLHMRGRSFLRTRERRLVCHLGADGAFEQR